MRIAIRNNNDYCHTICRTNGQTIIISPKDFVIFSTEDEQEINYWTSLKDSVLNRCGLTVISEDSDINALIASSKHITDANLTPTADGYVSVLDSVESPIIRQIIRQAGLEPKKSSSSDTEEQPYYNEEMLSQLSKEDLQYLCDNFNIKYKKYNSKSTLIKLILGSGVI